MIRSLESTRLPRGPAAALLALTTATVTLGVACGSGTPSAPTPEAPSRVRVVTTTAILADFVRSVGGDLVEVRPLVPPGADVHSFQSTPGDSIAISNAGLVVSNGLGLDAFLDSIIGSAAGSESVRVAAAAGMDGDDPHLWLNPLYAAQYVERIRDGLIQADPENAREYEGNAASYIQELRELDEEIAQTLSGVPPARRHLVTFHDAFGHFAHRYGWKVSAFVPDDASDVTPGAVVAVTELLEKDGIPAMFIESQFQANVLTQTARDAGVAIGLIYSDAPDDVPTYVEMMRFNAQSLLEHLG